MTASPLSHAASETPLQSGDPAANGYPIHVRSAAVWFATVWTRTAASSGMRANAKYTAEAKKAAPQANRSGSNSSCQVYESHSW